MELYSHYNGQLGFICFAIWIVMLIKGRSVFTGKAARSNDYWFVFFCMLFYSVLGFLEWDSYHYYDIYKQIKETGFGVHVEPFYVWLINILPDSYLLFRFVIWGTASYFSVLSFRRLKLNANTLAGTIPLLFLAELTNTRGSLGLALMIFFSLLFIQSLEGKKIIPIVLAIAGIVASGFLHRSMFIFIAFLLFAYLIPINKYTIIISLIAFPFIYGVTLALFDGSFFLQNLSEEQLDFVSVYQEKENSGLNLNGLINLVFSKIILLLLVFIIVKKYLYQKNDISKSQFFLFKYAYVMIYVSFLFLRGDVSNWLSIRTLHAGSFALLMCAADCYDSKATGRRRTLMEQIVLLGFVLTTFWRQFTFMRDFWNGN